MLCYLSIKSLIVCNVEGDRSGILNTLGKTLGLFKCPASFGGLVKR